MNLRKHSLTFSFSSSLGCYNLYHTAVTCSQGKGHDVLLLSENSGKIVYGSNQVQLNTSENFDSINLFELLFWTDRTLHYSARPELTIISIYAMQITTTMYYVLLCKIS